MKFFHRNNKGFTLVELLVVIGIMGIVLTAISTFLITNLKTFYRADDQIETQYNTQIAMNEIIDNILEAEGIHSIVPVDAGGLFSVNEVIFKINDNKYFKIDYNSGNNSLRRGFGSTPTGITTNQFANRISDFKVDIIEDAGVVKGIFIEIKSTIDNEQTALSNQVYFRNSN